MGGTTFWEGLEGQLNILSIGLPLDSFYNNLNFNDKDLESFYSECESLYSKNKYFKHKRLCSILLRFLKVSSTITENINSAYDDCILFNYWMYGELSKKHINKDSNNLVHAFAELQSIWNSLIENESNKSYYDKCKPDFDIPKQDDWKQRRDLYDYCVNYELLKREIPLYKENCKQYYAYIKGKTHLYEHFKTRCRSKYKNQCPEFYSRCKDYDPVIVLRDLSCYDDMQKEEAAAAKEILSVEAHPKLPAGDTLSSDVSRLKKDSSPPVSKAGDILLGVVVTTMTSGALYKFTPLGRMLRNGLGRNNNIRNLNGADNGLFDYTSEIFNPYSGEEHYIGYHPA
ncbi:Plasmodium vivax Vir protein, putative [Plasmodium vivax]|uniref:Vir protein, putative n=1 Tax=Plasmodium vivax TaxID=5855 RepID=A0A1G4E2Q8_PLAVI|nr:Plasmodium vivax Vir protein, putative [Plasmodium vivax]